MEISHEKCLGCAKCVPFCPVSAIRHDRGKQETFIDLDECVECGLCRRIGICPADAIEKTELKWPRSVRSIYSDPLNIHKETGLAGRGTEESKTNDVTGRFKTGEFGIAIEVGRPGIGTRLIELEKLSVALAGRGIEFEPLNPLTNLIDKETGKLPEEILHEKVLSAIIEFKVRPNHLDDILSLIKEVSLTLETVISVDLVSRTSGNGSITGDTLPGKPAYECYPNGKVNIGLGRL